MNLILQINYSFTDLSNIVRIEIDKIGNHVCLCGSNNAGNSGVLGVFVERDGRQQCQREFVDLLTSALLRGVKVFDASGWLTTTLPDDLLSELEKKDAGT